MLDANDLTRIFGWIGLLTFSIGAVATIRWAFGVWTTGDYRARSRWVITLWVGGSVLVAVRLAHRIGLLLALVFLFAVNLGFVKSQVRRIIPAFRRRL